MAEIYPKRGNTPVRQQTEEAIPVKQVSDDNLMKTRHIKAKLKNDQLRFNLKDKTSQIASLGLFALGMTGVVYDLQELEVFPKNATIYGMGFFFAGFTQFVSGICSWIKGNAFGAAAFTIAGAYWMSMTGMLVIAYLGWPKPPKETQWECSCLFGPFSTCSCSLVR